MDLKKIKCQYCGQDAYRLALIAMLQDLGCSTNNPADSCYARDDGLPHDFCDPEQKD